MIGGGVEAGKIRWAWGDFVTKRPEGETEVVGS